IMWSASLALNGLTRSGMGATPFPVHMIEHSLSALYDVPHAAGLSIVMPGWLKYKRVALKGRIAQLGRNVFGIAEVDDAVCAAQTIERLTAWYDHIGSPSNLTKAGIPGEDIPGIAENVMKLANVWNEEEYTLDVVTEILELCN
ncbi:MAG: NADH-dependent alcohol dehydrogenase, partial [Ectothiorhodospiraceae bacterium]|nr:NADH-dependent alcohol dehydrogenase [Ectothiorhodospiraceae bacterium]